MPEIQKVYGEDTLGAILECSETAERPDQVRRFAPDDGKLE